MRETDSASINRLRWRCRRGTRELDQLLSQWLTERYEKSDSAQRESFERMLEATDPDLWDWLTGNKTPEDPGITLIVDEIRTRNRV